MANPVALEGVSRADQARSEGVTDHEYCHHVDRIGEDGAARNPHLTPPRKDRMVAPYASCAPASQGQKADCQSMDSGAAANGIRPAAPRASAGDGALGSSFSSLRAATIMFFKSELPTRSAVEV